MVEEVDRERRRRVPPRIPYPGGKVKVALNDHSVRESREYVDEGPNSRIARLWGVINVDDVERAGPNGVMLHSSDEDIGVDCWGKVRKNLEIVEEMVINVDSHLRRGLESRLFYALPLFMGDRSYKGVTYFVFGGGHISDERNGIFLNK